MIKKHLRESGMSKTELARRINTTSQNVYGIFKRKSIDTGLLQKLSDALGVDFFQYYTQGSLASEPPNTYLKQNEAALLKQQVKFCEEKIALMERENEYLREINDLLKEKISGGTKKPKS
ncbi:MAG: helix-turn-helix transcriptional regulator [Flavobacteriales bacterium]|nr:helix-turn-helix transcriptional regulator [Flavobacteriales bacterium]